MRAERRRRGRYNRWMAAVPNALVTGLVGWLSGLRYPALFVIVAALFLVDLIAPDVIPFLDEIVLGLTAALLAGWKRRRTERGTRER